MKRGGCGLSAGNKCYVGCTACDDCMSDGVCVMWATVLLNLQIPNDAMIICSTIEAHWPTVCVASRLQEMTCILNTTNTATHTLLLDCGAFRFRL